MRLNILTEAELPIGGKARISLDRAAAAAKGKGRSGKRKRIIHDWNPTLRALGKYVHPTTGNLLWCVVKWDADGDGTGPLNSAQKQEFEKIKHIIVRQPTNRDRVRKWRQLQPGAFDLAFREYDDDLIGSVTEIPDDLDVIQFRPDVEFDQRGEPVTPTTPRAEPETPAQPAPPPVPQPVPPPAPAPVPQITPRPAETPPEASKPEKAPEPPETTERSGEPPEGQEEPEKEAPPPKEREVGIAQPSPAPGFKPTSRQRRMSRDASDRKRGNPLSWLWRGMKNIGTSARKFFRPKG